jgi:hypothetical protein
MEPCHNVFQTSDPDNFIIRGGGQKEENEKLQRGKTSRQTKDHSLS